MFAMFLSYNFSREFLWYIQLQLLYYNVTASIAIASTWKEWEKNYAFVAYFVAA